MKVEVRLGEDRLLVDEDPVPDGEMVGELCRRGDLAAHASGGCRAQREAADGKAAGMLSSADMGHLHRTRADLQQRLDTLLPGAGLATRTASLGALASMPRSAM